MENFEAEADKNAEEVPGVTDLNQCLEACSAKTDCKSADWSSSEKCHLHIIKSVAYRGARTANSYQKVYCTEKEGKKIILKPLLV